MRRQCGGDNWSAGKIALSKFARELGEQTAYCNAKNRGELISRNLLDPSSHALPSNRAANLIMRRTYKRGNFAAVFYNYLTIIPIFRNLFLFFDLNQNFETATFSSARAIRRIALSVSRSFHPFCHYSAFLIFRRETRDALPRDSTLSFHSSLIATGGVIVESFAVWSAGDKCSQENPHFSPNDPTFSRCCFPRRAHRPVTKKLDLPP